VTIKPTPAPAVTLRVKQEPPAGYAPVRSRVERDQSITGLPYVQRGATNRVSSFPWKVAAGVVVLLVAGGVAGRGYLLDRPVPSAAVEAPKAAAVVTAPKAARSKGSGGLVVATEPAGTRVLLDGKAVGETPLTLESITPGRHVLTCETSSGSFRKTVRIEAGKTMSLDVPVYSGWVAVFAPIPLDIAEDGRSIGTTEQGRLMLPPGHHELTLSNRELGYKTVQGVDIQPGEERSVSVQPMGELSLNAIPWGEVWIDGFKKGETPLASLRVLLGTHEIVFKHPQFPDRRLTVTVNATSATAATIDFTKPSPY
jgi:hypothetical protein